MNFEQVFTDAKVIKLEQNYRSTGNILNAANAVIAHNKGRKAKALWTENEQGEQVQFRQFDSAYEEAEFVVRDIRRNVNMKGEAYNDHAILYRTNAQSRMFEEKLVVSNIPYKIVGGINFYARREIKDLLAYLKTIENGKDDLAVRSGLLDQEEVGQARKVLGAAALTYVAGAAASILQLLRLLILTRGRRDD